MGLQITNDGINILKVDIVTLSSTSVTIEFSGENNIYVGEWIIHLWNKNLDNILDIKSVNLERGSVSQTVNFNGLTSETTYNIGVVPSDYSLGENSFEFTTTSNTTEEEVDGFTIVKEVTSHSAYITVTSNNGDGNEYYYDLYLVNSEIDEEYIQIEGGSIIWDAGENMPIIYQFENLISNTTYWLETGILGLGRIEFVTSSHSMFLSVDNVTNSTIKVSLNKKPKEEGYDVWTWYTRKVGSSTIIDSDEDTSAQLGSGSVYTVTELESNTEYYIWVELENYSSENLDIVGIYVTTLPSEKFSWTYAGMDKNGNPIKGDTKGINGAEYFFLTATEWNEYVTKLCEVKDQEIEGVGTELLPSLLVEANDPFTATLYSNVLGVLWSMDGIGEELLAENLVDVNITPSHLNNIKDRLNAFL